MAEIAEVLNEVIAIKGSATDTLGRINDFLAGIV
jgi:hypothetical protein